METSKSLSWIILILLLLTIGVGTFYLWQQEEEEKKVELESEETSTLESQIEALEEKVEALPKNETGEVPVNSSESDDKNQTDTLANTGQNAHVPGFIQESLSYPGQEIPDDMKVCLETLENKTLYCTQDHLKGEEYTYGLGYILNATPGTYYVYATTSAMPNVKAYYSEFVTCGLYANCPSHEPIPVKVESGKTSKNVDPWDWYHE